jgi:hypothetical protein
MNLTESKIDCWVLNETDDDYNAVWEIVSVLHRRLPDEGERTIEMLLNESLNSLLSRGLVKMYRGVDFRGEEVEVEGAVLPGDFVHLHKDDWKNLKAGDVECRFLITEKGVECLNACNPEYFK